MKPNPSVMKMIRDVSHDDEHWDDLPELVDVSDFSDDESESEHESELDENTPRPENKVKRYRVFKRGRDGSPVWPRCTEELFSQAIQQMCDSMMSWRGASTGRGGQISTLDRRNVSPATLPRRNQFLADQFFERGARRTRDQVARDLERRRMWYQGKARGNK